jgi:hypothetical protein
MAMMNKRAWVRILEATIAVMIISGVLLVVYSKQESRSMDSSDYFRNLHTKILSDISLNSDLRANVLYVSYEDLSDGNFSALNDFVNDSLLDMIGYSIRVCNLSDPSDACKMDPVVYVSILDKDVYVDDVIISSQVSDGSSVYSPKKFRLFLWEKDA